MKKAQILINIYTGKDLSFLKSELKKKNDYESLYYYAKILFLEKDYEKALKIFEKIKAFYDASRCKLLMRDLNGARNFLKKADKNDNTIKWMNFLIDIIEKKFRQYPSFFQIRNFLEIDLNLLLENNCYDYIENIMKISELFARINPESNKFFARVLYCHNYIGLSQFFLDKSLDVYFQDPETHYIKAQCFIVMKDEEQAIRHLNYCLEYVENYVPAKKLLKTLTKGV